MTEDVAIIIVAAGRGTRAGDGLPKQWRPLGGRPVLAHSLETLAGIGRTVLVVHPDDMVQAIALAGGRAVLVAGGESRAESVRNALEQLDGSGIGRVLIHDGARPFVRRDLAERVLAALGDSAGAAPAVAITDALWTGADGRVSGSRDRAGLYRAQTPQGFRFAEILAAHRAHPGGAADDVEVARAAGLDVTIVEGDEDNIKLTWPEDFARAERHLAMTAAVDVRTGNGYDVHAFTDGAFVTLAGVRIPHDRGLLGHSDADVAMHALTDALYGALSQGDIGRHFPPSDPQWKGADSATFLAHAAGLVVEQGYRITSADVTIVCERPKIGPHAGAMQAALARILGIAPGRVSVKATTSERLGFTGREEGIAAIATATLVSP